jgi:hypothetical protein
MIKFKKNSDENILKTDESQLPDLRSIIISKISIKNSCHLECICKLSIKDVIIFYLEEGTFSMTISNIIG